MYSVIILAMLSLAFVNALNLNYLDPIKLQTKTPPNTQEQAALRIINLYSNYVNVQVNPLLFNNHKDTFSLRTKDGELNIRASSGVAAVWAFNYYLKKYCKSQIAWQNNRVEIPSPLPEVDEVVVANDRFRYYQNVCTASYSFLWWDVSAWTKHVQWMALNGINLALAPIAQEAAWARIYRRLGLTDDEIDEHFTGPAFLSWFRMGNVRGWGGPLPASWHNRQRDIQESVLISMFELGMVPVLPAFNGHVPKAFSRIFPNTTFYDVDTWNKFDSNYCCGLFMDPKDEKFITIGQMFLTEISAGSASSHIYSADPFNEVKVSPWSSELAQDTAHAIFSTLKQSDDSAVWLIQNWMFVHDPILWPLKQVKSFITSVPNGRMLILDLQSEQWPQYDLYEMYYGQPFIWCMLHNFGGTLGMFGNMKTINQDVYEARRRVNSTMLGVGLTPEGINQNYVMYDLMLESAWRAGPHPDLGQWLEQYAERRYGCNDTSGAWKYLLKSVYNFDGLNKIRGKYVVTRRPSFKIRPWAWYSSHDLFEAFRRFAYIPSDRCDGPGFFHDLVDVARQALQYRADQLYLNLIAQRNSNSWVFNATIAQFLDLMEDMENILATNSDFSIKDWLNGAQSVSSESSEKYLYDMNARNQITLWGPNGEISDYACKQWAEMFHYYYTPRWRMFLESALDAKLRNEPFDERGVQYVIRYAVEKPFLSVGIDSLPSGDARLLALSLYEKWSLAPGLEDLPRKVIQRDAHTRTTFADTDDDVTDDGVPTVIMLSTTPV